MSDSTNPDSLVPRYSERSVKLKKLYEKAAAPPAAPTVADSFSLPGRINTRLDSAALVAQAVEGAKAKEPSFKDAVKGMESKLAQLGQAVSGISSNVQERARLDVMNSIQHIAAEMPSPRGE